MLGLLIAEKSNFYSVMMLSVFFIHINVISGGFFNLILDLLVN